MTHEAWTVIDVAGLADLDRGPRRGVATAAFVEASLAHHLHDLAPTQRAAALGLALLWHDDIDAAHALCQAHEGDANCDYVHGLLHRREGDYSNAKYWFRQADNHPIFSEVAKAAQELGVGIGTLVVQGRWQSAAMVDACARACQGSAAERQPRQLLQLVQAAEFRALATRLFAT
jgi:hypothetical protein